MIRFDASKVRVEHVHIKSVTAAMGGSVSIVDKKRSTAKKEVYTRVKIPHALARDFIITHKIASYIKPVVSAIVYYQDKVIAIERHPLGNLGREETEGLMGKVRWESNCERQLREWLLPVVNDSEWYIDGVFLYQFTTGLFGPALSSDLRFRQVNVSAIKLADLASERIDFEDRVCLMYTARNGQQAVSPPIWKSLEGIGQRQIDRASAEDGDDDYRDDDDIDAHQFDKVDEMLCVNLAFGMKAAREVAGVFGYDAIEPLSLPDLMLKLKTVNLPNVAKAVKQTYDIGLPFTHTVAWLLGLLRTVDTLDSYIVVRSLLKYLTTKGVYRKNAFNKDSVLQNGLSIDDVPLKTLDEALGTGMNLAFTDHVRLRNALRRMNDDDNPNGGGLSGAE